MFFTDLDGKLLICSFNVVENKMKEWKPIADEIMNSSSVKLETFNFCQPYQPCQPCQPYQPYQPNQILPQISLLCANVKRHTFSAQKDTRSGFGDGIAEVARKNPNIVALTADLAGSLKLQQFMKEFPERFVQCGIGEANMIGIAAGLTIGGKIPYTTTFANFSTGRVYDQIRQSVAYSGKNVKICASHAGLTLGEDGATHQILEDIGLMKMLAGMTVIVPCDYAQTKAATIAIADYEGPVYLRFGRPVWPIFTNAYLKLERRNFSAKELM